MIRNVSMKTTEDHSPITIIGYNNNKKFLIIHPPTKEGGRKGTKAKFPSTSQMLQEETANLRMFEMWLTTRQLYDHSQAWSGGGKVEVWELWHGNED